MHMTNEDLSDNLIDTIANLLLEETLDLVRQRISRGHDPLAIVEDCQTGLQIVGERYEQKQYYLAGLIMAGEIFRQVMEILMPIIAEQVVGDDSGCILLGTVQGDIHDIGKNNFSMLLRCYGFSVIDLGVDVSPKEFLRQALVIKPDIVGLSGLLSITRDPMRETVGLIKSADNPEISAIPVIIGGGLLNDQICEYVSADAWASDAMSGVHICQKLIAKQSNSDA
jgi:methanogenic corrinoid protein MtbC1